MSESLYALLNRQELDRAHRLLVAQQLAEVVETVHAAGGVIGNLDTGRVLVEPDGTVKLSDDAGADTEGRAAAYTAPEMQGSVPGYIRPEAQHDCFALAVLLFQLLMEGHHPYAGQWVGGGNLPEIPKAIQLGLYAYGNSSVTPPPDAPALGTLEPGLADLFKRSFGATSAIFRNRPTGAEWARTLAAARQTGQDNRLQPAPASPELAHPSAPIPAEPAVHEAAPASTSFRDLELLPGPALQSEDLVRIQRAPLTAPGAGPTAHVSTPDEVETAPEAASQGRPEAHPEQTAAEPGATSPPVRGTSASRAKRSVPRGTTPPRAAPPDASSAEPTRLAQSARSWSSTLGDHVGELRQLAQPDGGWSSRWSAPVRDLLTEMAAWKQVILLIIGFLLFLIVLALAGRNDDWANPPARPAVVRATRVPTTETPRPQPTATSIALVTNPTVASFGNNFDISDRALPSTGERFSANIRNKALRLEVFGKGARGKAMFNAAPAQGDFNFTVHVGAATGQGEILIYVRKPESGRTWAFAVDPGANTWGIYEEPPWSDAPTPVIAHTDSSGAIGQEPLRTVTVTREGTRISLLINGTAVSPRVAGSMPRIGGAVTVGVGAMIPENPEDYDGESFVVTVDRVAMLADEE